MIQTVGKGSPVALLAILCVSFAVASSAQTRPAEYFDTADLEIGIRGTAHTVLQGDEATSFEVELLGLVPGTRPQGELILFRAHGDSLLRTGIVAGMSGSPVYVEDKLVGAIAFAFGFSKEPLGLITPISEMLEALDRIDQPVAPWLGAPGVMHAPFREAFLTQSTDVGIWDSLGPVAPEIGESPTLIGLTASGWAPGLQPTLDRFANRAGLPPPTAATGRSLFESTPKPLVPGSAIGVRLIDGDAALAAIGTVTYVDGDKFLAFGHPMFQGGPVSLPVSAAWIHAVIPTINRPFKMGSAGPIIGTIRQDRRAGVAGIVGEMPPQLPVTIVFNGPSETSTYNYRLARGILLEPNLLAWTATNSFLRHGWRVGFATLDSRLTVNYNGNRSISRSDRIASRVPASEIAQRLLLPVPFLLTNPFEEVSIDSVSLEVSYQPELKESVLTDLWARGKKVRTGDTLHLTARLQDHQKQQREVTVDIYIPERLRGQNLLILAGGAMELVEWDRERAPGLYEPTDLDGIERLIEEFPSDGELLVRLYGDKSGVLLGDKELGSLPPAVAAVLGAGYKRGSVQMTPTYQITERRIDVGGTVSGAAAVRVKVE